MKGVSRGLIIGISIGVIIGAVLAIAALFCIRFRKKHAQIGSSSSRRAATIPIRANGADCCTILSDSTTGQESPKRSDVNGMSMWLDGTKRRSVVSASGIPKYPYKYVYFFHPTEKRSLLLYFKSFGITQESYFMFHGLIVKICSRFCVTLCET